ncbi:MAG: DNA polymerase I [Sulfobacillus acidophilus]|uniref:DNA polymerase I n=1 Tax=Sulfobacillus acidophilus TaxID=53633 RepID=A0A2T2WDX7_9FIRM|nr:MAG: DNA polymerase I [Sulfobacillus acidophilus]
MPTQLLIDGHSLLFRAYHALPPLTTRSGIPTGAIHGFATMLFKVVEAESPRRVVVVFDAPEATFRHEQYGAYKAQREKMPDDLREQLPYVRDLLQRLGVPVLAIAGYEADDTLGTLARMGLARGFESLIVTGDRDLLQLVDGSTTVLLTSRTGISDLDRMDREAVKAKMGVWPEQVPDLKGLMGDSSDNIPGIAGIGQKSAVALIDTYRSLENIYSHLDDIGNPRWHRALSGQAEMARRYRDLATIVTTVPVQWPSVEEPFQWHIDDSLIALLNELELTAIKKRLGITDSAQGLTQVNAHIAVPRIVDEGEFAWATLDIVGVYRENEMVWVFDPIRTVVLKRSFKVPFPAGPRVVVWDAKDFYRAYSLANSRAPTCIGDVKLAAYLLDSERHDYTLAALLRHYQFADVQEGTGETAAAVMALFKLQQRELRDKKLDSLYENVELPLARVLGRMEAVGVLVDRARLEALGEELTRSIQSTERTIYELAGETFNINSQRQLGEILFTRLGLPVIKRTKTGYSTDAETLEALMPLHPIIEHVLLWRQLVKIQGTYVDGLLPLIQSDGRIHTTFHQTVAATGRLSSSDPNLQNIPVRLPLGRRVRSVFCPSPGRTLLAADYSQIELRVLAHLAHDANLIQAFLDGEDIHRRTASEIFNLPLDEVDSTWRNRAKAVNFGIIYGISDFGLARDTGVTRSEAREYIDRYYQRYPQLKVYFDKVVAEARENGYVSTILGRRRPLPDINDKNRVRRQYAERMAMNTVIQGSAADLIKVAMVNLDVALVQQKFHSQMILQVHDELIWDAYPAELKPLAQLARQLMTTAIPLSVPLVVEFKRGENWEAVTAWDPETEDA